MMFHAWVAMMLLLGSNLAGAAEPVGSIVSVRDFFVRGSRVTVAGVPSWPLLVGDDIVLGKSSALLSFKDGTRILLERSSRLRIERAGGRVIIRVQRGSGALELSRRAAVSGLFRFARHISACHGRSRIRRGVIAPQGCSDFSPPPDDAEMSPEVAAPSDSGGGGGGVTGCLEPSEGEQYPCQPTPDLGAAAGSIILGLPGAGSESILLAVP